VRIAPAREVGYGCWVIDDRVVDTMKKYVSCMGHYSSALHMCCKVTGPATAGDVPLYTRFPGFS
jgi:hypothetical protein